MQPIKFDFSKNELCEILGISSEQADEMVSNAIHETERPDKNIIHDFEVLMEFLNQGSTIEEKIFLAYQAGGFYMTSAMEDDIEEELL